MLPLEKVFAYDADSEKSGIYAKEMSNELGIEVTPISDLKDGTLQSDVIITCTPTHIPYLMKDFVKLGTTIGAIGADSPDKQELEASLLQGNKVVVDILKQCAKAGELHHALDAKLMTEDDVHGELGLILSGKVPGRENNDEIIIYDATGTAIQDTASVAVCYEKAISKNIGIKIRLNK